MRRIGLYSLIALVSLALVGALAAGVGAALNSGGGTTKVEQANTPTVPKTVPEKTKEQTKEKTKKQEKTKEQAKEQTKKQEKTKKKETTQQQAADQQAADQQAADQQAQQQAAAQQAQQDKWRKLAEQRDAQQQAAQQAAAEKQQQAKQAAPKVPASAALNLTIPKIGLQNAPVTDSLAESVLANGPGKLPASGFPWQSGSNTYIAGHVYGYPGTGSWQLFADLPSMAQGDQIFLTDSNGTTYQYRVSQILRVAPTDVWVTQPTGQTTVSLQTCVGPGWSERMIVRGTLVGTSQA